MSEVKRYRIVEDPNIGYVLATDYDALAAKLATAVEDANRMGYALACIAGGHWRGDVQEYAACAVTGATQLPDTALTRLEGPKFTDGRGNDISALVDLPPV